MKILNRDQIYEADHQTLTAEGITSDALMERAATLIFEWLHRRLQGAPLNIHIFCGTGNNGGDGLVVARHLLEHGYHIKVFVVKYSEHHSPDFLKNLSRLQDRKLWPQYLDAASQLPEIPPTDVVIDAIFGIGLNRPPADWVGSLMAHLNTSGAFVLSIDIPSGLYIEKVPEAGSEVIVADHVLTFGAPKLVFFLPQTGIFVKNWEVLDIGLSPSHIRDVETAYVLLDNVLSRSLFRPRTKFSHKGTFGHTLIIGGAHGKIGAVILAAQAALLSGSGLVTACVPGCGYIPLQTKVPEAMVLTTPAQEEHIEFPQDTKRYTKGVGMGLGTSGAVQQAFLSWLSDQENPVLLDADALNILGMNPKAQDQIPAESILTPHPGELRRLIGEWEDDFDKLKKAFAFARLRNCILLIKGAHTLVIHKEKGYINTSGNPGMATGGSGDVLSGMITGLLAQGYGPLEAALLGVYLHGRAGDLIASDMGYEALTASGILSGISLAYRELNNGGVIKMSGPSPADEDGSEN